ncbi:TIR-NBS-LRR resistance protein, partial [Trifolium medium]|nr:TIR-NBS-LRR resistance protein [Trifolium medium]
MQGTEYWFHYTSTQVSFTHELPSNLLGFAYYLVLSQGRVGEGVGIGCECYLDDVLGERICITSIPRANIFKFRWYYGTESTIHMSDHVVLWYDPVTCKQIMDAVNDVNNTSHSPKLTFRFFIDESETLYDEVSIKECGFRWIYQDKTISSTIFESHDEDEETVPPTKKLKQRVFGTLKIILTTEISAGTKQPPPSIHMHPPHTREVLCKKHIAKSRRLLHEDRRRWCTHQKQQTWIQDRRRHNVNQREDKFIISPILMVNPSISGLSEVMEAGLK